MTRRDWGDGELRSIGLFLNGDEIPARTRQGDHVTDESFLVLFNSGHEAVTFLLAAAATVRVTVEARALDRRTARRGGRA